MKLTKALLMLAVVFTTVACGKIPSAYQGQFADTEKGTRLELGSNEGTMTFADGRILKSDAKDMTFEALSEGKAGIFVSTNPQNGRLTDVYWVNPNMATKQEVEGFVWYQSEVIYTLMDAKREDKVPNIQFFHCQDGMVMLDKGAQRMQVGCPAGPANYNMIRAAEKK